MFEQVPIVEWNQVDARPAQELGPALLVTHGCVLDKRTKGNAPNIRVLQFLPLRDVDELDPGRRGSLLKNELTPAEPLLVGDVGGWTAFVALSEVFGLPAGLFDLQLKDFANSPDLEEDGNDDTLRLVAGRYSTRLGRLEDAQLELFYRKIALFWARMTLTSESDEEQPPGP